MKEKLIHSTAKQAFITKKQQADDIRKRCREKWTVKDITTLPTYKRQNDNVVKPNKVNCLLMLEEWDRRSHQPTPPSSPIITNGLVLFEI
jgi:hypothetical protein